MTEKERQKLNIGDRVRYTHNGDRKGQIGTVRYIWCDCRGEIMVQYEDGELSTESYRTLSTKLEGKK